MKCVIITNGDIEYTKKTALLIKKAELIICADGGARHLRALDILPDILIGDFDSIKTEDKIFFEKKKIKTLVFPSKKNLTDTEICINYAIQKKAKDITLLGAIGTRFDHTLANILFLKNLTTKGINSKIINKNNEIYLINNFIKLIGKKNDILSIIPISKKVMGIRLKGFKYPLKNTTLKIGSGLGISNVFKKNKVCISIQKGILLVIKSKD